MSVPDADRLAEIQARADAATPGPWQRASYREFGSTIYQVVADGQTHDVLGDGHGYIATCGLRKSKAKDAEFIANARSDVPFLLAALRVSRERETRLASYAKWLASMDDPDDPQGLEERRSITLTRIIDEARAVLAGTDATSPEVCDDECREAGSCSGYCAGEGDPLVADATTEATDA